jgi:site-specific recombinase XerD
MPPTVEIAMNEFLLACVADGLAHDSVKWYRSLLGAVLPALTGLPVDAVETSIIRQYVIDLRTRTVRYPGQRRETVGPISAETLRDHIVALRRFFNWCVIEYRLDPLCNPMLRVRIPPKPRREPKAVDLDDLRKLIEACGDDPEGLRNRAILIFLADTGCRAGGLVSLKPDQLQLDRGRAIVHEKGDRARAVPFSVITAEIVKAWLAVRPAEAETVFCSLGANAQDYRHAQPMTVSGLNQMIKRLKKRAGVTGRCNPHSFRHAFAREYLRNGGDLATLSQILGHSNVSVTMGYAVFDDGGLKDQHERFGPLRNL